MKWLPIFISGMMVVPVNKNTFLWNFLISFKLGNWNIICSTKLIKLINELCDHIPSYLFCSVFCIYYQNVVKFFKTGNLRFVILIMHLQHWCCYVKPVFFDFGKQCLQLRLIWVFIIFWYISNKILMDELRGSNIQIVLHVKEGISVFQFLIGQHEALFVWK